MANRGRSSGVWRCSRIKEGRNKENSEGRGKVANLRNVFEKKEVEVVIDSTKNGRSKKEQRWKEVTGIRKKEKTGNRMILRNGTGHPSVENLPSFGAGNNGKVPKLKEKVKFRDFLGEKGGLRKKKSISLGTAVLGTVGDTQKRFYKIT